MARPNRFSPCTASRRSPATRYHSIILVARGAPLAFEILTPDEMAKADRLTIAAGLDRRHRPDAARRAAPSRRSSSSAFPTRPASPCWPGPATMAATAMSSPRNCAGPASTSRCGAPKRRGRAPTRPSRRPNAPCRRGRSPISRRQPAGWSSTRCSAPAWRGALDGVYAEAIARLDAARRARRRRRPAERRVGPERRSARNRAEGRADRHLLPQEARASALSRPELLRRDRRRRYRHSRRRAFDDRLSLPRKRSGQLAAAYFRRRPPTPTNMRAAMSACFPAGRLDRRGAALRRWRRRAPGQGR